MKRGTQLRDQVYEQIDNTLPSDACDSEVSTKLPATTNENMKKHVDSATQLRFTAKSTLIRGEGSIKWLMCVGTGRCEHCNHTLQQGCQNARISDFLADTISCHQVREYTKYVYGIRLKIIRRDADSYINGV